MFNEKTRFIDTEPFTQREKKTIIESFLRLIRGLVREFFFLNGYCGFEMFDLKGNKVAYRDATHFKKQYTVNPPRSLTI